MFSPLRNRFGIPGVISVIALVFAMLGGAYAASNSSGGGEATASAKAKRGPKGPKGATGPAGPAGPQGAAGANGKDGANGSNGSNGTQGSQGLPGKSVAVGTPSGAECEFGGAVVEVSGEPTTKKKICSGEPGAPGTDGAPGSPWTAGGTLPVGSTETGSWAMLLNASGRALTHISFTIPLAGEVNGVSNVHVVPPGGPVNEECKNASHPGEPSAANPEAASGHLCVYSIDPDGGLAETGFSSLAIKKAATGGGFAQLGASTAGAELEVVGGTANAEGRGTWAVTG